MEKARESLGKDLGGRLAQALSKAGERKRVLAHSVHQKDREVSDRAFAQSVGFETTAGQQRLRDKFALKILNAALQAMEEQPPQKEASQPSQLLLQPSRWLGFVTARNRNGSRIPHSALCMEGCSAGHRVSLRKSACRCFLFDIPAGRS